MPAPAAGPPGPDAQGSTLIHALAGHIQSISEPSRIDETWTYRKREPEPLCRDRVPNTHTKGNEDPGVSLSWLRGRRSDTRGGGKTHGRVCPGQGRGDQTLGEVGRPTGESVLAGERQLDTRGGGKTQG